ncbi:uncharacterized protein F4807DRAFT_403552 [Annulohypoxylon truncatum]|uniref:uncharacterized protein n=1 Tax=Annulohypoxylon truncatum TaxID=327061 RepID=UPI002007B493|nr:uncharacterized protein F4807DRAFT_403552 [Annulohypoxylon truncatum]KAI1214511.1 hypothetical protein F4807DRAFT_403552 [Annulohypoxylon truncatum]
MDNLNDLLDEHISREKRRFVAFGIGTSYFNNSLAVRDAAQDWTIVSIYIDGVIGKSRAIEVLRQLEDDIDRWLSPSQKPERLAFYLEDNSNRAYSAKSYRIRGRLSPGDLSRMGVVSTAEDGDKTPPATPRSEVEDTARKDVEEIEL